MILDINLWKFSFRLTPVLIKFANLILYNLFLRFINSSLDLCSFVSFLSYSLKGYPIYYNTFQNFVQKLFVSLIAVIFSKNDCKLRKTLHRCFIFHSLFYILSAERRKFCFPARNRWETHSCRQYFTSLNSNYTFCLYAI